MKNKIITSIESFISEIRMDYEEWNTTTFPWFRGEPTVNTPLLPKLYRKTSDDGGNRENQLNQFFRMKAPTLGYGFTPDRGRIDEWLFLMQHVGLPTRLLDWTEGALVALYFALREDRPVVWMLDPVQLNRLSTTDKIADNVFPLSWVTPKDGSINIGSENFRGAWESDRRGTDFPIAVHPTNIHPRMSAQKSCFTIHGKKKIPICDLVDERILIKYIIKEECITTMRRDIRIMGISHSSLFPDLDGLAEDLASIF
jgi:hypothetical protein